MDTGGWKMRNSLLTGLTLILFIGVAGPSLADEFCRTTPWSIASRPNTAKATFKLAYGHSVIPVTYYFKRDAGETTGTVTVSYFAALNSNQRVETAPLSEQTIYVQGSDLMLVFNFNSPESVTAKGEFGPCVSLND
jgi:hypothetical protein